jgi:2-polyprenyl-3-methyl-5-hydroxy-6-metoxy-1,4-benzoquinol methylase
MSRINTIVRNLRLIFSREFAEVFGEIEERLNNRADTYEKALDTRADERFAAAERHADDRFVVIEHRAEDRFISIENRADERFAALEQRLDQRAGDHESALDARIEERLIDAESRIEQRLSDGESRLDKRFEERSRSIDNRLDDRFARIEREINERFNTFEERTDERMERHERKIDAMIRRMSQDIVERNDVMLQIFEQRLDKHRRELRDIASAVKPGAAAQESSDAPEVDPEPVSNNGSAPHQQLISFRKLADVTSHARAKIQSPDNVALYHQILNWKKIAHEGMDTFTPDEQETVDYILSFLDDPKEIQYVREHLRRFVSTLQRIPPALSGHNRLLELGSLSHLAPAIKKYCGYKKVCCADFWESDEKVVQQTVRQKNGTDTYTFELRNFNVERDSFPYPDGHFRVVLCCELIEHLQSDPMHMLWECNRVLEDDGYLLLTTPNIASARAIEGLLVGCTPYLLAQYNVRETVDQHNREYAPYEVGVVLAAAGFTIVELETEDVWLRSNPAIIELLKQVQISSDLRGDNIFALARKTSAPIERYPKELYTD